MLWEGVKKTQCHHDARHMHVRLSAMQRERGMSSLSESTGLGKLKQTTKEP